jgi:hypothetical protein
MFSITVTKPFAVSQLTYTSVLKPIMYGIWYGWDIIPTNYPISVLRQ